MRVAIVFDTHTGITAAAAEKMAEIDPRGRPRVHDGIHVERRPGSRRPSGCHRHRSLDQGWFIVRQHPSEGALTFLEKASLNGKPVAVFATYKLAVGSTVTQLANAVERGGGRVTGMYKAKGPNVPQGFEGWVASLAA